MPRRNRQSQQNFVLNKLSEIQFVPGQQCVKSVFKQLVIRQHRTSRPQLEQNIVANHMLNQFEASLTYQPNRTGYLDMDV